MTNSKQKKKKNYIQTTKTELHIINNKLSISSHSLCLRATLANDRVAISRIRCYACRILKHITNVNCRFLTMEHILI